MRLLGPFYIFDGIIRSHTTLADAFVVDVEAVTAMGHTKRRCTICIQHCVDGEWHWTSDDVALLFVA